MEDKQLDLCRPCLELLRGRGKRLALTRGGSDNKITCSNCGRRRYGATYKQEDSKSKA